GKIRAIAAQPRLTANPQPVGASPAADGLVLVTGRSLFTSWEGASIRSEDADKLHREEAIVLNPRDAADAGLRMGDAAALVSGDVEVRLTVQLDDGVGPGWAYVPHYYDGGAAMALLPLEGTASPLVAVRVRAMQTACDAVLRRS